MSIKARRRAFLNKTVKYYNSENRGIDKEGMCSYEDGCAIGRFLPEKVCITLDNLNMFLVDIVLHSNYKLLIPKELRYLGSEFLSII